MLIELGQQGPQRLRAPIAGNPQGQVLVVARGASQEPGGRVELESVGEAEQDMTAADLPLEVARSALGDHVSVVEYRDPVGELIGFVEVLGGEEDRYPI